MLSEDEKRFLDEIYRKYAKSLFYYSLSLLKALPDAQSLAEECMQETFEIALRKIRTLRAHALLEGWLYKTCRQICLSRRRKLYNRRRITGPSVSVESAYSISDQHDLIDEWVEQHDAERKKQRLKQALTVQELSVFRLYFEQECSVKACAESLGLTETAVQGTIQRIRGKAKKTMR